MIFLAGESDERNKSQIPVSEDYGEKKGIPAGRPGRDEDIAQAGLQSVCVWTGTLTIPLCGLLGQYFL